MNQITREKEGNVRKRRQCEKKKPKRWTKSPERKKATWEKEGNVRKRRKRRQKKAVKRKRRQWEEKEGSEKKKKAMRRKRRQWKEKEGSEKKKKKKKEWEGNEKAMRRNQKQWFRDKNKCGNEDAFNLIDFHREIVHINDDCHSDIFLLLWSLRSEIRHSWQHQFRETCRSLLSSWT